MGTAGRRAPDRAGRTWDQRDRRPPLLAADSGVDPETFFESHGWSAAERAASRDQLVVRGLLDANEDLTEAGRSLRSAVESLTDDLALIADALVIEQLDPLARAVARSGVLPFPNPMGLPAFADQV